MSRQPGKFAGLLCPTSLTFRTNGLRPLSDKELEIPPLSPDVAVEILSPGDCRADVDDKIAVYLQAGSSLVIVVDPQKRSGRTARPRENCTPRGNRHDRALGVARLLVSRARAVRRPSARLRVSDQIGIGAARVRRLSRECGIGVEIDVVKPEIAAVVEGQAPLAIRGDAPAEVCFDRGAPRDGLTDFADVLR